MGEQGLSLGHSLADTLAQILLHPDKRSSFLALGSAAVSGKPAATCIFIFIHLFLKNASTMFLPCLKDGGGGIKT